MAFVMTWCTCVCVCVCVCVWLYKRNKNGNGVKIFVQPIGGSCIKAARFSEIASVHISSP